MDQLLEDLRANLDTANKLKTGERSEAQRRLAILCTELEKLVAFTAYACATWDAAKAK